MTPIKVYEAREWGARPPTVPTFERGRALGVCVHNTEWPNRAPGSGAAERAEAFRVAREIQNSHMDGRGWFDSGHHFLVSRGGVVVEGRHSSLEAAREGLVVQAAHANDDVGNRRWYGVELEGDYRREHEVPARQWEALIDLAAHLSSWAGFPPDAIEPHMRFSDTDCPGLVADRIPALRVAVALRRAEIEAP